MKKTLIGLHVPAIQEQFDLFVPVNMDVAELIKLLVQGVEELYSGYYTPSEMSLLTMKEPDLLLQPGKMLEDYGVADGTQLILF